MLKPKIVSPLTSYVAMILFAIFASAIPGHAAPGVISTVAGNGTAAYSGDGGLATSASLNSPNGVAVDSTGNIYMADFANSRIRKVDTNGVITTVAGNGTPAYSGDGGLATSASLNFPIGVAVDSSANIYIVDLGNSRIRKVDTNGVITTVAGNGTPAYSGDGGPATSASLFNPYGVAVDSLGNIYIADFTYSRIRKVDTNGVITTIAGNGTPAYSGDGGLAASASLSGPRDVAVDSTGNSYIADSSNHRIRKVDTNGVITTVAGNGTPAYNGDGGLATSASLYFPYGVAIDSLGNIYIADSGNHRIRQVDINGVITTIAGNGMPGYSSDTAAATSAMLNNPRRVAVDSLGNIYIADSSNNRIRKVEAGVSVSTYTVIYTSNGGSSVASQSVAYNTATTAPTPPTKTGYTFAGWYSDVGLTTAFAFTTAITGDTTLYAKWTSGSPLGNCTSTNATVISCELTNIPAGQSGNFTPKQAVSIGLTGVTGSADICITFNSPPSNPVLMKFVNGAWGKIYPGNPQWSGISNVTYSNGQICFNIQDNSDADGDNILGTIADPVVIGDGVAQLVILKSGGAGIVVSDPGGITCGSTCAAAFSSGVSVTLTATPDPGSVFSGWLGEGCSGRGTCTVRFEFDNNNDYAVTATFSKLGDVDGNGQVEIRDTIVALQVVSGATPASPLHPDGDVDGNGKIGLPEAIFTLQYTAELRNNDQREKAGSITIVKNARPNDAQDFTFTSDKAAIKPFLLDDDGDNTNTLSNQKGFSLAPGSYTFRENPVSNWNIASIACKPSAGTSTDTATGTATVILAAGDNVTCTFDQTKQTTTGTASLTIVKAALPNDAQDFAFYAFGLNSGSIMPFLLDDDTGAVGENTLLSNSKTFNLLPGSFSVTENFDNPVPVTGWDLTGIICTSSAGTTVGTVDLVNRAFTVDLAAGDNVTCTFTNTKETTATGSICGIKFNDINGNGVQDAGELGIPNWQISLGLPTMPGVTTDAKGAYCFHNLPAGTYTVSETVQAPWQQTFPPAPGSHRVTLAAGETILGQNFGNTLPTGLCGDAAAFCNGSFEVQPVVSAGSQGFFNQALISCWNTTEADGLIEIWGSGFGGVPAYSGNQFAEVNAHMGATLYQNYTAIPGSTVTISFAHRGRAGFLNHMSVSIGPAGGTTPFSFGSFSAVTTAWTLNSVTYTFPNNGITAYELRFTADDSSAGGNFLDEIKIECQTDTVGSITIVKDAAPDDPQDFFFTFGNSGGSFVLDDDGDNTNTYMNHTTLAGLAAGPWSFTENAVAGWDLTGIACTTSTGTPVGSAVDLLGRTVTVNLAGGDNVTCTFTNRKQPIGMGTITIVKDAVPDDPQDFHFTTLGVGLSDFDLDDDPTSSTLPNSQTFTNLAAGVPFTVTEDAVSGWTVPSIQCTVAVPGLTTTFTDQLNRTFTVNLEAGANVTCTFTNVKTQPTGTGTITIVKDAVPDDPQDFEFHFVNNDSYTYLDDDNDSLRSNQHLFSNLGPGSYTFTETVYQLTGWDLTGISCTPAAGTTVDLPNRAVTVNLAGGDNVTCTFINTKQPDGLTFTAVNGPTLQVSTQAMIPTVLMTPTAFTSSTTGSVTTATVTAGPAGVPNDDIFTLVSPYSNPLVGAVATLPSSVLLASGLPASLPMTATSCGGTSGGIPCPAASLLPLFSADFGRWAITDALPSPYPTNAVITYIAFAGGTQLTTTLPTSGTATYTGKMTGVLANTPIGGSDDVSGDVILNFDFSTGTMNGTLGLMPGIVTTPGVSTITPCVYPLSAPACTYTAYASPTNVPFNDITLSGGTITGNSFSATVTTPAITGATTMTMTGNFYGTTANEVAGTFTISVPSPGMILIGSFGAKF